MKEKQHRSTIDQGHICKDIKKRAAHREKSESPDVLLR
jgi:hypothetical protein